MSIFQNYTQHCTPKERKYLIKKWEPLHLTLDNSKSEEREDNYYDKIKNVQGKEDLSYHM